MGNNPHACPISTKEAAKNRTMSMAVKVLSVRCFIVLLFFARTPFTFYRRVRLVAGRLVV